MVEAGTFLNLEDVRNYVNDGYFYFEKPFPEGLLEELRKSGEFKINTEQKHFANAIYICKI